MFSYDDALDAALTLFRRQGYDGTSLGDLTASMGINPPSLYRAFGSKRELFHLAVERYMEEPLRRLAQIRSIGSARDVTTLILNSFVEDSTRTNEAAGCFMVQGALVCADDHADVSAELAKQRLITQESLDIAYARAVEDGELALDTDTQSLSVWVATVAVGITVQAASGVSRSALDRVVTATVKALPYADAGHSPA